MIPYWLLFAYFGAGVFFAGTGKSTLSRLFLVIGAVTIALMIGLRYEVGGDWFAYQRMFAMADLSSLGAILQGGDPGYQLLNWLVQRAGADIWLVNLVCGAIFAWGLFRFCWNQPEPWLAVLVAVPYLVIVVAMGYSRQAVAIGILMAGLASLERGGSLKTFVAYTIAAALFHKTAVIALPLVFLGRQSTMFMNFVLLVVASVLLYFFFLSSSLDRFFREYLDAEYSSEGAGVRVAMSLVPAALFLLRQRAFRFGEWERIVWRNFSIGAIGCLLLLLTLPSSAAVDRMALYVTPLQIAVLSRVPGAYVGRGVGLVAIILYSLAVQYVWLNYATHAVDWIPYRIYPFF